ncbi:MAG: hypothetical protein C0597_08930 [Marinilabiliales bacterium]|nr:MAG: hypothetical protein C0597_08930 [Marinilabiliales bacterium]
MIKYTYNKEIGILETIFEGEISSENMIEYIISIREDRELPEVLRIFSDTTNGKLKEKFGFKNLKQFLEENKITLEKKEFVYDAYLISKPFEMALGMLYKALNNYSNYKFDVFSSRKAAIDWLKKENK